MPPKSAAAVKPVEQRTDAILTNTNSLAFDYDSLNEAFPEVDPGLKPLGNLGVFLIRRPKMKSAGGIDLPSEARSTEYYNTQVAKCVSLGDLAFKTVRNIDGEEQVLPWPEGPWFKPGDFVRVPKYGGDRFTVKATVKEIITMIGGRKEPVEITEDIVFAIFKVREIQGVITGDPLKIRAYID